MAVVNTSEKKEEDNKISYKTDGEKTGAVSEASFLSDSITTDSDTHKNVTPEQYSDKIPSYNYDSQPNAITQDYTSLNKQKGEASHSYRETSYSDAYQKNKDAKYEPSPAIHLQSQNTQKNSSYTHTQENEDNEKQKEKKRSKEENERISVEMASPYVSKRHTNVDVGKLGSVTANAAVRPLQDSDAYQGEQELVEDIRKTGLLEIGGSIARQSSGSRAAKALYGGKSLLSEKPSLLHTPKFSKNLLSDIKKISGYRYVTNLKDSSNLVGDFKKNQKALESYLEKKIGIKKNQLQGPQIRKTIKNLKKKINDSKLSPSDKKNALLAISELERLKKIEPDINNLKGSGGFVRNTAQTLGNDALGDGDAKEGLDAIKTGYKTTRTTAKVAKQVGHITVAGGSFLYNAKVKLETHREYKEAKKTFKYQNKQIKKGHGDAEALKSSKEKLDAIRQKRYDKYNKSAEARQHIFKTTGKAIDNKIFKGKIGKTKERVISKFKNTKIGKLTSAIGNKFSIFRNSIGKGLNFLRNNSAIRFIKDPFKVFSAAKAFKQAIKKVALYVIGMLLGFIVIAGCIVTIVSGAAKIIPDIGGFFRDIGDAVVGIFDSDSDISEEILDSVTQQYAADEEERNKQVIENIISTLYGRQKGVYQNTGFYNNSLFDYPQSWVLHDPDDDLNLLNNPFYKKTFTKNNKELLLGYDLTRYYGAFDKKYTDYVYVGEWTEGKTEVVEVSVPSRLYTRTYHVIEIYNADGSLTSSNETLVSTTFSVCNSPVQAKDDITTNLATLKNKNGGKYIVKKVIKEEYVESHIETTTNETQGYWTYHLEPMTITGCSGLKGNVGTFSSKDVYIDETSDIFLKLLSTPHNNVNVKVNYYKKNEQGMKTSCTIDDLYKTIIAMDYGFTQNEPDAYDFHYAYCRYILYQILNSSVVTMTCDYRPEGTVEWEYEDPVSKRITKCSAQGLIPFIEVEIDVTNCDIMSAITLDKTTNGWAHSGSMGLYSITDPTHEAYVRWDGWMIQETISSNGVVGMPPQYALAMGRLQNIESENLDFALSIYEESDADFWDLFGNPLLPSQIKN